MVRAENGTLAGVLEGKKQYQVPLYQRVYSWGKNQLEQIWTDIVELASSLAEDPKASHFIGSLVLASSPDFGAIGVNKFLVVDGQQRLTTLTLLLAALRDHLIETGDVDRGSGIDAQYLINVFDSGKPLKIMPTQKDRAPYLAVLNRAPQAGGEDAVGDAYRFSGRRSPRPTIRTIPMTWSFSRRPSYGVSRSSSSRWSRPTTRTAFSSHSTTPGSG